MKTVERVIELANERDLSLFRLSQMCQVSYNSIKSCEKRGGQLTVDTIERICDGLGITMSEFFAEKGA